MSRWAVVLAGGSGTRFWPLSTKSIPKQMLPLAGGEPLLQETVQRLGPDFPPDRILIVTAQALADTTRRMLPHLPPENVLGEPRPASTAPALTWATVVAGERDPDAAILSLHADWFVGDDAAFRRTATRALDVAETFDLLVTVGIVPERPEVGYGYIEPGVELEGDARAIDRFTEKPSLARAEELIAAGALWNSGLFAWSAARFLSETRELAPEIAPSLRLLETGDVDAFFDAVTPIAVDVSHYERAARCAVVPGKFPWDDVGTWAALPRVRSQDDAGNTLIGDVVQREASNCVGWAEDGPVVLHGVENLVVVRANGMTLVTTRERALHLKDLLATLPDHMTSLENDVT